MNKSLCKYHKRKGTFKRTMCQLCSYLKNCVDYEEYKSGHSDELRDLSKEPEQEERNGETGDSKIGLQDT